jgi:alpha-D-ribose 1-methylphosphonate 5-triphosphate synthase subunit PhnG
VLSLKDGTLACEGVALDKLAELIRVYRKAQETAATRVDFYTLVRGEG